MIDLARITGDILGSLVDVPITASVGMAVIFAIMVALFTALFATGGLAFGAILVILLLMLVVAIAVLFVFFKLAYQLLTRYVIFLLLVMFAPLFFLFGALPKGEGVVLFWFKRATAALLAIPVVGLVVELSFAIGFSGPGSLAIPNLSLLGGIVGVGFAWAFLSPVVGLGMFFYATKIPDMIDELLGVGGRGGGGRGGGIGGVLGAPLGALSTLGTLNRAAPTLAGWAHGGIGSGGWRGKLAEGVYGLTKPFSAKKIGEKLPSVSEIKEKRTAEKGARAGATVTKTDVVSTADQSAPKGSTGPKTTFGQGTSRMTPDRGAQQTDLKKKLNPDTDAGGKDDKG